MEQLDRAVQREMLRRLLDAYPEEIDIKGWLTEMPGLVANGMYLAEHGLITLAARRYLSEGWSQIQAKVTAKGVDFMLDDGGLTAVLGVVTVRLHDDTIKALIADRIQVAGLPPADKQRYLDRLRSLPADATRHLVLKLLEQGLAHAPDILPLLRASLGLLG